MFPLSAIFTIASNCFSARILSSKLSERTRFSLASVSAMAKLLIATCLRFSDSAMARMLVDC